MKFQMATPPRTTAIPSRNVRLGVVSPKVSPLRTWREVGLVKRAARGRHQKTRSRRKSSTTMSGTQTSASPRAGREERVRTSTGEREKGVGEDREDAPARDGEDQQAEEGRLPPALPQRLRGDGPGACVLAQ